jgi:hypothetical protein
MLLSRERAILEVLQHREVVGDGVERLDLKPMVVCASKSCLSRCRAAGRIAVDNESRWLSTR